MSSARIRLEGGWERLEAALPRYRRARELLRERNWLAAVRRFAHAFESAALREAELETDFQRALSLSASDKELAAFVAGFDKAKVELLAAMAEKLGEKPASIADGVSRLLATVRLALPGPPRAGERTLAVIAAEKPNEAALGVATVFGAPYLVALSSEQPDVIPWVIGGAGVALAGFIGRALTTAVISGTCTVTTERVVWRPHRGEARQFDLSQIKVESVRLRTPRTVELRGPDLVSMRMLESPGWAATAVALQAWAGANEPGPERVAFPCTSGRVAGSSENRRGFAIVWPKGALFIPSTANKRAAAALLGTPPRFNVDMDALCTCLAHLPEQKFQAASKTLIDEASAHLLDATASVWRTGPVEVILGDATRELWAKLTPRNEQHLRHALEVFGRTDGPPGPAAPGRP